MKVRQESADLSKVLKACGVNTNCLVLTNQLTEGGPTGQVALYTSLAHVLALVHFWMTVLLTF